MDLKHHDIIGSGEKWELESLEEGSHWRCILGVIACLLFYLCLLLPGNHDVNIPCLPCHDGLTLLQT